MGYALHYWCTCSKPSFIYGTICNFSIFCFQTYKKKEGSNHFIFFPTFSFINLCLQSSHVLLVEIFVQIQKKMIIGHFVISLPEFFVIFARNFSFFFPRFFFSLPSCFFSLPNSQTLWFCLYNTRTKNRKNITESFFGSIKTTNNTLWCNCWIRCTWKRSIFIFHFILFCYYFFVVWSLSFFFSFSWISFR